MIQDNSALTSVRLARSLRRGIVGIIFAMLLTPPAYAVAITAATGSTKLVTGDDAYVILATFQYQIAPGFALFPNLALLVAVAIFGIRRTAPWLRTALVTAGAVLAALVSWLLASLSGAMTPQIVALCAALIVGWFLAALPLSAKKPGWGRP